MSVEPITVNLTHNNADYDHDNIDDLYDGLHPETHEMPMWELIKSFTKPTVITLDRTITAEADEIFYEEMPRNLIKRKIRNRSPLGHVQEVTSGNFSVYRTKAIQYDNELKARIVMSALQDPKVTLRDESIKSMKDLEIEKLEEKIIKYLTGAIKTEDVTQQVKNFFASTRIVAQHQNVTHKKSALINLVFSQYRQVENLAKAFNDFEIRNAEAFKALGDYLKAVNKFFIDSNKSLYFDESTGRLVFSFLDSNKNQKEKREISHLSSGEKQILILFTFLAFISKSGSVFIVDEPELSLHPKWQYDFMEVFLQLRPPNTQLLIATHSPDIVGKLKHACVILKARKNA